jgi:membrane associated rhomboid family serine protease
MRCPECARERTRVHRMPSAPGGGQWSATYVLIVINVAAFLAEVATGVNLGGSDSGWVFGHGALFGAALTGHNPNPPPFNGTHQYWRLLTAGFLHASLLHIALNMLSLWFVGRVLEPGIGARNFLAIYFASLLAGSFGALLFQPDIPTLGASTAIFGIFGALIVVAHARGIPIWQSGLAPVLLFNLVFTLTYSGISIGGHIGGLAAGLACGWLHVEYAERRRRVAWFYLGCLVIACACVIAGIAVAGDTGLTPNGFTI